MSIHPVPHKTKSKWQSQHIHKLFKNRKHDRCDDYYNDYDGRYSYYDESEKDTFPPYHVSDKYWKNQITDYKVPFKYNHIPIWICSKCNYRNTQRKSFCIQCTLPYSTSKSIISYHNQQHHNKTDEYELRLSDYEDNVPHDKLNYYNDIELNITPTTKPQIIDIPTHIKRYRYKTNKHRYYTKPRAPRHYSCYKQEWNCCITIKLLPNDIYSAMKQKLKYEHITGIQNLAKYKAFGTVYFTAKSFDLSVSSETQSTTSTLLPSTKESIHKMYKLMANKLVIVMQYGYSLAYAYSDEYFRINEDRLQSLCKCIWDSRYGRCRYNPFDMGIIKYWRHKNNIPRWNVVYDDELEKSIFNVGIYYKLRHILREYITSNDITEILFQYLDIYESAEIKLQCQLSMYNGDTHLIDDKHTLYSDGYIRKFMQQYNNCLPLTFGANELDCITHNDQHYAIYMAQDEKVYARINRINKYARI